MHIPSIVKINNDNNIIIVKISLYLAHVCAWSIYYNSSTGKLVIVTLFPIQVPH